MRITKVVVVAAVAVANIETRGRARGREYKRGKIVEEEEEEEEEIVGVRWWISGSRELRQ